MILNLNEYAYKKRQLEDKLYSNTEQIIEHLFKLYLLPNHSARNHWKQEIYSFLHSIDKLKGSNKRPTPAQIYTWTFGNKEDTIDNYFVKVMIDTINYQYKENIKLNINVVKNNILFVCRSYFKWLAKELSTKGIVSPQQIYKKLDELFI